MAAAAFWVALAAVLIAGIWRKMSTDRMRHETLRIMIEKGEQVSDQQVKDLLDPPPHPLPVGHPWLRKPEPGAGKMAMKVIGALLLVGSIGIGSLVGGISQSEGVDDPLTLGFTVGAGIFLFGLAFFFAAAFMPSSSKSE